MALTPFEIMLLLKDERGKQLRQAAKAHPYWTETTATPTTPGGWGPDYEAKYRDALGDNTSPAVIRLLALEEMKRRGIDPNPASPVGNILSRASHVAAERFLGGPLPDPKPTAGSPTSAKIADVMGEVGGIAANILLAQQIAQGAGHAAQYAPVANKALTKFYSLPQGAQTLTKAAAQGLARGGAVAGMQAAKGQPVEASDIAKHAAFYTGGALGGQIGRELGLQAASHLASDTAKWATASAVQGATAGLGAGLAAQPFAKGSALDRLKGIGSDMAVYALLTTANLVTNPDERTRIVSAVNQIQRDMAPYKNIKEVLGRMPKSIEEAERLYRSLAKASHPDVGGSEEEFVKLNAAYKASLNILNNANLPPTLFERVKSVMQGVWEGRAKPSQPMSSQTEGQATSALIPAPVNAPIVSPTIPTGDILLEPKPEAEPGGALLPAPAPEPKPVQTPVVAPQATPEPPARPIQPVAIEPAQPPAPPHPPVQPVEAGGNVEPIEPAEPVAAWPSVGDVGRVPGAGTFRVVQEQHDGRLLIEDPYGTQAVVAKSNFLPLREGDEFAKTPQKEPQTQFGITTGQIVAFKSGAHIKHGVVHGFDGEQVIVSYRTGPRGAFFTKKVKPENLTPATQAEVSLGFSTSKDPSLIALMGPLAHEQSGTTDYLVDLVIEPRGENQYSVSVSQQIPEATRQYGYKGPSSRGSTAVDVTMTLQQMTAFRNAIVTDVRGKEDLPPAEAAEALWAVVNQRLGLNQPDPQWQGQGAVHVKPQELKDLVHQPIKVEVTRVQRDALLNQSSLEGVQEVLRGYALVVPPNASDSNYAIVQRAGQFHYERLQKGGAPSGQIVARLIPPATQPIDSPDRPERFAPGQTVATPGGLVITVEEDDGRIVIGRKGRMDTHRVDRDTVRLVLQDQAYVPEHEPAAQEPVTPIATPEPLPTPSAEVQPSATSLEPLPDGTPRDPMVQHTPPNMPRGRVVKAWADSNTQVWLQYVLLDQKDLIASHDSETMAQNPLYPQSAQPRDRSKAASLAQLTDLQAKLIPEWYGENTKVSEGAPALGVVEHNGAPVMIVESGNMRSMAIKGLYHRGDKKAEEYREWLRAHAEEFGLTVEQVDSIEQPVLARLRVSPVSQFDYVVDANRPMAATLSPAEQAMVDAAYITPSMLSLLVPDEDGFLDFTSKANSDFRTAFLQDATNDAERAELVTKEGFISQAGVERMKRAVFASAYGNPQMLQVMSESTDANVKNIANAMVAVAARMADLHAQISAGKLHPLSMSAEIAAAALKAEELRRSGKYVSAYLNQTLLLDAKSDLSPISRGLLEWFELNKRSAKRIAELMAALADGIEAAGLTGQGDLFGGRVVPTKGEVLAAAIRRLDKKYGTETKLDTDIFENYDEADYASASYHSLGEENREAGAGAGKLEITDPNQATPEGTRGSASIGAYDLSNAGFTPPLEPEGQGEVAAADSSVEPNEPWTYKGAARTKEFLDRFHPIEQPELVELTQQITGHRPGVKVNLHGQALGRFLPKGRGHIDLRADIARGPEVAQTVGDIVPQSKRVEIIDQFREQVSEELGIPEDEINVMYDIVGKKILYRAFHTNEALGHQVLAHEIGHLDDYMPEGRMDRGNLLGRVASAVRYLKNTMSAMPNDTVDAFLTQARRAELMKQAIAEVKQSGVKGQGAVKEVYQRLIQEEIKEHGLVDLNAVTEELRALSQRIKPFDEEASPEYTAYRHSSPELYADAISVMLTQPHLLGELAPQFTEMLVNYAERKPEMRKALEDLQSLYADRDEVVGQRVKGLYEMLDAGEAAMEANRNLRQRDSQSAADWLIKGLWDADWAINKEQTQRARKGTGQMQEDALNASRTLSELRYMDSRINVMLYDLYHGVIKPIEDAGLDLRDAGVLAFLTRISEGDRDVFFNPRGITPSAAKEIADFLRSTGLGEEAFEHLQEGLETFRRQRQEHFFDFMKEERFFSPEQIADWEANSHYATFNVQKYLDKHLGGAITPYIYQQHGTFEDITNPFVATVLKQISMMYMAKLNSARRALIKDLQNVPGEVTKAEMPWSTGAGHREPAEPADPNLALFPVVNDGKTTWYVISKDYTDSFGKNLPRTNLALELYDSAMGLQKDIFTGKNLVWMIRNVFRDFAGTLQRVEQLRLRDAPKLLSVYLEVLPEVIDMMFHGTMSEGLRKAYQSYAIAPGRIYASKDMEAKDELERLLKEFALRPDDKHNASAVIALLKRVGELLDKAGGASELMGKYGGFTYLERYHPEIAEAERAELTRTRVSTPDFKHKREWDAWLNRLFLFSGINTEGWRATAGSAKDNPARFWWKAINLVIIPKLVQYGVMAFAGTTALGKIYTQMNRYNRKHYAILPLALLDERTAVYLRFPQDYAAEAIGAVMDDLLAGRIVGPDGALNTIAGLSPYNLSPLLDWGRKAFQVAALSDNPEDAFYGSPILSDNPEYLGLSETTRQFAAWSWNNFGGSALWKAPQGPHVIRDEPTLKKVLRMPILNMLGTFLCIDHDGEYAIQRDINQGLEIVRRKASNARRKAVVNLVNNGYSLDEAYDELVEKGSIDPEETTRNQFLSSFARYAARKGDKPWEYAVVSAPTTATRRAYFAHMSDENRKAFADRYDLETGAKLRQTQPKQKTGAQVAAQLQRLKTSLKPTSGLTRKY